MGVRMSWLAGVDGCKKGWFRVCRERATGRLVFDVVGTVHDLVAKPPHPSIVALDMPIGLPEAGDRQCDKVARAHLGWPRRTSVFVVPVRPAIGAATREE